MATNDHFSEFAERAYSGRPHFLARVTYHFSRHLFGREDWFAAFSLPGASFGWRYQIELLALKTDTPNFKNEYIEQYDSYSLSLSGAKSAALGQLPRGLWPWVQHRLDGPIYGPWGFTLDFNTVLEIEHLRGPDWLSETIRAAELLENRLERAHSETVAEPSH